MDFLKLNARAKINITLDVLGKRDDGYHELSMIMQTINLCDNVFIKKNNSGKIEMQCNLSWMPCDERNLVYQAADILKTRYDIKDGIFIDLTKNIPIAAGLAGGSSDCAATLVGIRNLFKLPISNEELMAIGKELGADVPYCIMRGTALAEGIGEKLTPLSPFPNCYVLICKPPINVSTATVFGQYDTNYSGKHPDNKLMIKLIEDNDLEGICQNMYNVLESVTIANYPIVDDIKKNMIENGALGSMMSGSGPTVFGFFKDYDTALNDLKNIRHQLKMKEIYVTTIYNHFV